MNTKVERKKMELKVSVKTEKQNKMVLMHDGEAFESLKKKLRVEKNASIQKK